MQPSFDEAAADVDVNIARSIQPLLRDPPFLLVELATMQMRAVWLVGFTLICCSFAGAGENADSHDAEIDQLISQLGAPEFLIREDATNALWEFGLEGESALREALSSSDREVVQRAQSILEKFEFGILPDTPPKIIRLIEEYRRGGLDAKEAAGRQLIEARSVRTLFKLIGREKNEDIKRKLSQKFIDDVNSRTDSVLRPLILAGEFNAIDEVFEMCSPTVMNDRHYTSYKLLTGELESAIEENEQKVLRYPIDESHRRLVFLYRALGNWEKAIEHASKLRLGGKYFVESLLVESGDWKRLSDRYCVEAEANELATRIMRGTEYLAYATVFHRLAREDERLQHDLAAVQLIAETEPSRQGHCAKVFIANNDFERALEINKGASNLERFMVYTLRHEYERAFESSGIGGSEEARRSWFQGIVRQARESKAFDGGDFRLALQAAGYLHSLGLVDEATQFFDQLVEVIKDDTDKQQSRLAQVCSREFDMDLPDEAWAHIAVVLSETNFEFALRSAFPANYTLSRFWWWVLERQGLEPMARLRLIENLVSTDPPEKLSDARFDEIRRWAVDYIKPSKDEEQILRYSHLATTCENLGRRQLAIKYMLMVKPPTNSIEMLELGDLYREEEEYEDALVWYRKAWEQSPDRPISLFLIGDMLEQLGDVEGGEERKRQAVFLPLASTSRSLFALDLEERGFDDVATEQWRMERRTHALEPTRAITDINLMNPQGKEFMRAFSGRDIEAINIRLGNSVRQEAPLESAECWNLILLGKLRDGINFSRMIQMSTLPQLIAYAQAEGNFDEGNIDEALRFVEISDRLQPGNSQLAEDFVPLLEEAGRTAEADKYFKSVYDVHMRTLNSFPNSALHHNNLAWFVVRCGRMYDEMLPHAEKAVELQPLNVNYLDTLAEVHYRLGNHDDAIRLALRCIKLDPGKEHYEEQLERFRAGLK